MLAKFMDPILLAASSDWLNLDVACFGLSFVVFCVTNLVWWCGSNKADKNMGKGKQGKGSSNVFKLEKDRNWYSCVFCAGLKFIDYTKCKG